jgi:hypothetical protein
VSHRNGNVIELSRPVTKHPAPPPKPAPLPRESHPKPTVLVPFAVRAARLAGLLTALAMGALLLVALPYYTEPLAARVRDSRHVWLKPSGTIGQALGVLALGLFLFLWLYPLRKRLGRRPALGSIPHWLDVHIVAGLLVPLVGAMHAGWRFEGLIGLGYLSMAIVCVSGLIGRYLYVHIPRSRTGLELSIDEVAAERRQLLHDIATASGRPVPEIERSLAPVRRGAPSLNPAVVIGRMVSDDVSRRRAARALRRQLAAGAGASLPAARIREAVRLARREMALAQQAGVLEGVQRLFRWWHAAHKPFAIMALVAVLLHVAVAVAMGQTWFH